MAGLLGSTALVMPTPAHSEGFFQNIRELPSAITWHSAVAVSGNGRYVVGEGYTADSGYRSFLYDATTGTLQDIGQIIENHQTLGYDVSDNGAVVGSFLDADADDFAFRWTSGGGFEKLGTFAGIDAGGISSASGVSRDGKRIVGWASSTEIHSDVRAFVWVEGATTGLDANPQMFKLGGRAPDALTLGDDISGNGMFAVGWGEGAGGATFHAIRWNLANLIADGTASAEDLGVLGGSYSRATGVSDNGVVVGWSTLSTPYGVHAFRWTENGTGGPGSNPQMEDLGTLGGTSSEALAVNKDGSIIVGTSDDDETYLEHAFRWTRETGMIYVSDWLLQAGVDVGGHILSEATGVSDNGSVIVGMMRDDDNPSGESPFIARVPVPESDPGPGGEPGPTPPPGVMNVNEYNRTLYDAGYAGWAGRMVANVPLNGAHHRPLMNYPTQQGGVCGWTNGDIAHYDDGRDTGVSLAEAGLCGDLLDGTMRIGLGGGVLRSQQDLLNNGDAELNGQYAIGEMNWRPDGMPVLFSLTGLYGGWDADIKRGYSNGAAMAYSDGDTDMRSGVLRLRADWQDAFSLASTGFSPYLAYTWGRTTVDGYTETGGPFPSAFDKQVVTTNEIRLGLASRTELTSAVTLRGSMELVHATGDAPRAQGQVVGLYGFDFGGGSFAETWVRAGADIDLKVTENAVISLSGHAATEGLDAQISGAARFQVLF
ncbi:autotransporter domain-containing protein [Rhizobium cremeum]|uniref:autotransporter domain-containing protein n=1 Tax=Rhizobium cremeum TaxID=2813827 RepID=UPI001FD2D59D|nr:autotransporter domain-containing protein [Rhizobium cremeum]MCJ7997445.1 autotransporter domain-containing protein [Rhizobium cremeum]MCJ8002539.1 autotransporter domain-containing protein [Rhizobium cremeum]